MEYAMSAAVLVTNSVVSMPGVSPAPRSAVNDLAWRKL
jgi:hypothetical protein